MLYREEIENSFTFKFNSRTSIEDIIRNKIEPIFSKTIMRDFYYEKYNKIGLPDLTTELIQATSGYNETTGYFADITDRLPFKVGNYTGSNLKYIEPGALIKFIPPSGYYFEDNGTLVTTASPTTNDRIWAKVTSVVGDGSALGQGILSSGLGPIVFNEVIPTGSILTQKIGRAHV